MKIKEVVKKLDTTLLILLALVLIGVVAAFWIGGWERVISGLTGAGKLIQTIWLRLILGFTMGGLIQVLIPRAVIAKWLGPTSGLKGILIGSYTGIIIGGGPFVVLPIIASMIRSRGGCRPCYCFPGIYELGRCANAYYVANTLFGCKNSFNSVRCLFFHPSTRRLSRGCYISATKCGLGAKQVYLFLSYIFPMSQRTILFLSLQVGRRENFVLYCVTVIWLVLRFFYP